MTKLTSYVKVMAATLQPGGELHCTLMMCDAVMTVKKYLGPSMFVAI